MTIKITPNDKGNPPGKLAEAELHFTDGPLEGLKLIGFAIWERRGGGGGRNVTFPARQYSINGERRTFALLRPVVDATAQNKLRELILEAFQEYEERAAIASLKGTSGTVSKKQTGPAGPATRSQEAAARSLAVASAEASTLPEWPWRTRPGRTTSSFRRR